MNFNKEYWEDRYGDNNTGWDIGHASIPLQTYIDQLTDKSIKILIPGAGRGYEAIYLFNQGFKNVTVLDFAKQPLKELKKNIPDFPTKSLIVGDFFDHTGKYDLILEQTFFCALNPPKRENYVSKMKSLLNAKGKLAGVLFNFPLTKGGPPFGGNINIYKNLFAPHFNIKILEQCYNSIKPRAGSELFFIFENVK
tara:strand:- start:1117 stop:1701 length:585 start_codon:yes stop_codon:yes gene_type:complete